MRNRLFIAPVSLLLLSSCLIIGKKEEKVIVTETDTTMVAPEENSAGVFMQLNYTGIVRDMSKSEGCGWMIELDMGNGEKQLLEPLTLDEAYQIDGKVIEFAYTDSRRPSKCSLPSKPITIDKIIK